ncbi:hypothetical protein CCHL11_02689 [Colletotrichum chlorophyti]|uniref:Uncharacterized protein n=1 Tax=Colletotrichum chlorophyti TaxID=708187 RepID=A0A1Q8S334_9PEZI|nr:hypothetical protein CCHL11_02689 [Colletotrichum chlorophyti]
MSSQPTATTSNQPSLATSTSAGAPSHSASEAARVIERTNSWKPSFERRQSWNKEDQKRELQMSHIDEVKTGPGFTERA